MISAVPSGLSRLIPWTGVLVAMLLVLSCAIVPASAQVFIVEQFANMEAAAGARCPEDPPVEPDFEKRWLYALDGVQEQPTAEMTSVCSSAWFRAQLSVSYGAQSIEGSCGSASAIDSLAGGHASLNAYLRIEVEAPTWFRLESVGEFLETGSPHSGGHGLSFVGGSIDHDTGGADTWLEDWTGTLQPGMVYVLTLNSTSERSARELPGGTVVTQDGTTNQDISFLLSFGAAVVGAGDASWGMLKARY